MGKRQGNMEEKTQIIDNNGRSVVLDNVKLQTSKGKPKYNRYRVGGGRMGKKHWCQSRRHKHLMNQGSLKEVQSLNRIFTLILLSLPQIGLISCCGWCANSKTRSAQTRVRKARNICWGTTCPNSKRVNRDDAKRVSSWTTSPRNHCQPLRLRHKQWRPCPSRPSHYWPS